MPLVKLEKINSNSFWCIWEITETEEQLKKQVYLSVEGLREIAGISHPIKILERMASRACVQELVRQTGKAYHGLYKDEHDKPYLIDLDYYISISHSYPYAVGILHKLLPVGIDIEKPVEKLGRIAHRFLNDEEFEDSNGELKKLCVYWTGKEAIYKLNGRTGLSFKKDIHVYPFSLYKRDAIRSEFSNKEGKTRLALNYRDLGSHIVSYCF